MRLGVIETLWRYPVKSMRGEELNQAQVSERGLTGDRAMALIDRETGKIASAKYPRLWGRLLASQAMIQSLAGPGEYPVVRITLPDGREVLTSDPGIEQALSETLGRAVTLSSTAPAGAETEREYPVIDGLPVSGRFFSAPIAGGAPAGTLFDYAPLHLITTATLARLRSLFPDGDFDLRRFRPNLVIATPDNAEGFAENEWVGHTLITGNDVRLKVTDPTPRCVITTLPQAELPRDLAILRTIAAHNRPSIPALGGVAWPSAGVYAVVERGGRIRTGDDVRLLND